jgi:hypothetical protein
VHTRGILESAKRSRPRPGLEMSKRRLKDHGTRGCHHAPRHRTSRRRHALCSPGASRTRE